jgi:hypothetical protein
MKLYMVIAPHDGRIDTAVFPSLAEARFLAEAWGEDGAPPVAVVEVDTDTLQTRDRV